MLIDTYDALMSGRRIRRIVFKGDGGEMHCGGDGLTVAHAQDNVVAEAWVCTDATGIWLSFNANLTTLTGQYGIQGQEEPLDSIAQIIFA